MYFISVVDSIGDSHILNFRRFEYPSLLELLVNELFDDIGDCKGKGLCGTCHIRIKSSMNSVQFSSELEQKILKDQLEYYPDSRLACQIPLDKYIHKIQIEIIGRD
ncbi:2Fe-2S iron-sulfur cluster-binding protein [Aquimarina sp. AU119]|uniref:2Fe-2S iron-sulfur cluster-binding protein n=1 Tax=Aquimarina sp. AU119 TaxID=2108528 RepID=UPI000D69244E|nr:2Fe-2S iron-sulfur cluster-binding protein [Aquimarina sp. AU119]